jgi:hypothetical protein
MIYIGATENSSQAIYLDIHSIEHLRCGTRVSAVIGDGCYEGEVLIECGEQTAVTYADAWLGGDGLDDFLQRCGKHWLREQLVASVTDRVALTCLPSRQPGRKFRPHQSPRPRAQIAETQPFWLQPA